MDDSFETLRAREFARLDAGGHAYLDYTGSGLYPESLIRDHAAFLSDVVLGNPHSDNPTSLASTEIVEDARRRVLAFFDANPAEYEVVFTPNATGALKIVGESFPWGPSSRYVLLADNHNSINGIRVFAETADADVVDVPVGPDLRVADIESHLDRVDGAGPSLFAFPAQSNFSGVKHPLEWIRTARSRGYMVLLDAAAFVPTSPLSLRDIAPDFVGVSFYKMFGYPTGVGVLIARRAAIARLRRPWYAGGTAEYVSAADPHRLLEPSGAAFEDGTVNFLNISAVPAGLDFLAGLGMENVNAHVMALTERLLEGMRSLEHADGRPLVEIYGPTDTEMRGATVAFNVLDADGSPVGFEEVESRASDAGISVRGGTFCNPGAAGGAFGIQALPATDDRQSACMDESPAPATEADGPRGAVRVSIGVASNRADVDRFLDLLRTFCDASSNVDASSEVRVHERQPRV